MATIHLNLPDELEEEQNVNVVNLHSTLTSAIKQLNYVLGNIDTQNMTEDLAKILDDLSEGE